MAALKPKPKARAARHTVEMIVPQPRPHLVSDAVNAAAILPPEQPIDLSHALPSKAMGALPSSAEQLQALKGQLQTQTPQVAAAKQKSDVLAHEAAALRVQLIDTAARIEQLERDKIDQDARIADLQTQVDRLNAGFVHDRVAVTRLIAVLERLQHDMPRPWRCVPMTP